MQRPRCARAAVRSFLVFALVMSWSSLSVAGDDPRQVVTSAPLHRLFLKEGGSVVSYGEFARVDDRVVFSMPLGVNAESGPELELVDLPSGRIDWDRTDRYSHSIRAVRYAATQGEADYARFSAEIARALDNVGKTADIGERLTIVQRARQALAEWPATHFNYKHSEVQDNLLLLDEAIADLRAEAGLARFDLSLRTGLSLAPPSEPLLPAPAVQDLLEQAALVARLTDQPTQRTSLLTAVLAALERHLAELPSSWIETTRTSIQTLLRAEMAIDRAYQALVSRVLTAAAARAKVADVRGLERLAADVRTRDAALGYSRPQTVEGLLAAVASELDAARRLQLERDRWALRMPELRRYQSSVVPALSKLKSLAPHLEDIKALSGSGPDAIGALLQWAADCRAVLNSVQPPDELRATHDLLLSVAQLVESAAKMRREAALIGSLDRAWNASSAAAGALMLSERARTDLQAAIKPPELSR